MKYYLLLFVSVILYAGCKESITPSKVFEWKAFDESQRLVANADHASERMQYKLIQSKTLDRQAIWNNIYTQLDDFSKEDYERLYPFVYERNILEIQTAIEEEKLNYEQLTKWYLYRILKFETDSLRSLNAIIAINPKAVEKAKSYDKNKSKKSHPIYGICLLYTSPSPRDQRGSRMPSSA